LVEDGLVTLKLKYKSRDPSEFRILYVRKPLSLLIGQVDCNNQLNGIGKKITPHQIIEGQFVNNKLEGVGRFINGTQVCAFGYWKDERFLKGYGKRLYRDK
jgi:hypothetical protein